MWVPPEIKDPVLLHHPTRRSVGYFGAVPVRDGRFFFQREPDSLNGASCFQFLRNLRRASAHTGRRVVVIADNATYHHARLHRDWRRQQRKRFALDFLPPVQPGLEPHRARLETHAPSRSPQSVLRNPRGSDRSGRNRVCQLDHEERNIAPTMRNYLRCHVLKGLTGSTPVKSDLQRFKENEKVERERHVLQIKDIVFELLFVLLRR